MEGEQGSSLRPQARLFLWSKNFFGGFRIAVALRARALYNAGFRVPLAVATASPEAIERVIGTTLPYRSKKAQQHAEQWVSTGAMAFELWRGSHVPLPSEGSGCQQQPF